MAQVTHFQRQASHDDLVERARQIVPHLRQRMKEMDQLGYLPEATVQELQDAELFQLTIPRIYGGRQVDMRTYMDVVTEIGRGDASTSEGAQLKDWRSTGFLASMLMLLCSMAASPISLPELSTFTLLVIIHSTSATSSTCAIGNSVRCSSSQVNINR